MSAPSVVPSASSRPLATRSLKLFSQAGKFIKELELPFSQEPPEVVLWHGLAYRRSLTGGYHYSEVSCWAVPAETAAQS